MRSKTYKFVLDRLKHVYRVEMSRSDSPRVVLGIHELTQNLAWPAAKAAKKLYLVETSPCGGLG